MKKLFLFLLVLPFVFSSCSDDDDDYTNADIVGTWVLQSIVAKEVKTNNEKATQAIKDDIESYNDVDTFVFSPDGKVVVLFGDGDEPSTGTYNLSGNRLTIEFYGEKNTTTISLSKDTFSSDVVETEIYQDEIEYLLPNEKDVVVSKVITAYTYKRK